MFLHRFAAASAIGLAAAASAPSLAQAPAAPVQQIVLYSYGYNPNPIVLAAGKPVTLTFLNRAGKGHDFTAAKFFASSRILAGSVSGGEVDLDASGTDRIAEVARARGWAVQGPLREAFPQDAWNDRRHRRALAGDSAWKWPGRGGLGRATRPRLGPAPLEVSLSTGTRVPKQDLIALGPLHSLSLDRGHPRPSTKVRRRPGNWREPDRLLRRARCAAGPCAAHSHAKRLKTI